MSFSDIDVIGEFDLSFSRGIPIEDKQDIENEFLNIHPFHPTSNEFSLFLNEQNSKEQDSGFLKRVKNWKNQKTQKLKRKIQESNEEAMKECTFKPKISKRKIIKKKKKISISNFDNTGEEISQEEEKKKRKKKANPNSNTIDYQYFLNLSRQDSHNSYKRGKEKMMEVLKKEREIHELKECTFNPKIKESTMLSDEYKNKNVFSRIYKIKKTKEQEDPECTFQPKINLKKGYRDDTQLNFFSRPAKKKRRQSLLINQEYLKQDAFKRLHHNERKSITKRAKTPITRRKRQSNPNRFFESPQRTDKLNFTTGEIKRGMQFLKKRRNRSSSNVNQFFNRIEQNKKEKKQKIERLRKSLEPNYKPKINKKSKKIIQRKMKKIYGQSLKQSFNGDNVVDLNGSLVSVSGGMTGVSFLDRMEYQLKKSRFKYEEQVEKEHKAIKERSKKSKISRGSRYLAPRRRSFIEMSKDHQRNKKRIERRKKEYEEEKRKEHTFKPEISNSSNSFQRNFGHSVNKFGQTYTDKRNLEHLTKNLKKKAQKQLRKNEIQRKRREDKIMEECTFQPRIKKAPHYIKKIAASYSKTKNMRKKVERKRDWR